MKIIQHKGTTYYDEAFIREAVSIVIGDDGFRANEVILTLRAILEEDGQ